MRPNLIPGTWVVCEDKAVTFRMIIGQIVGGQYDKQSKQWKYCITNPDIENSVLVLEQEVQYVLSDNHWIKHEDKS